MGFNNALLDLGGTAMANAATHISLATANPEPSGSNQATSARLAAGWPAVSGGGDFTLSNKAFTGGAANGPVTHVCFWSALTGGTYYGSQALTGDTTFNSAGEYTITSLTVTGTSP
jgi:hypothetical protein